MNVIAIKTKKVVKGDNIYDILDSIKELKENSVLAITSKILAICQGRIVKGNKEEYIMKEADLYLDPNEWGITISIKDNFMVASAGIDSSNGDGYLVLWPENYQEETNKIREYLRKKFKIENLGVIITDSKTTPLKKGTTGFAMSHSGFMALKNYINEPDIFGNPMHVTKGNHMEGLAATAVLVMGEGAEQTPLAILSDVKFIQYNDKNPNEKELKELDISIEEDIYKDLIRGVNWKTKPAK